MAKARAPRYADDVATIDEADDYDELHEEIVRGSAALVRQRKALRKEEDRIKDLVVRALKAGYAAKRTGFRSDIQKIAPFSVPTVRGLADEAGIPPDERYVQAAKVRKARAAEAFPDRATPAPQPDRATGRPDIPAEVLRLNHPTITRLAGVAEERASGGWSGRVLAAHPGVGANWHPYLLVAAALDEGILDERHVPR